MNENLKILADYIHNVYGKNKITHIWQNEVKDLFKNDKVDVMYEIYDNDYIGAWYYIITKNNMKYIVKHILNNGNTKMMMESYLFLYDKTPIKLNSKLLDIIYNYDKLTVYDEPNDCKSRVLIVNHKYSLIEEINKDKKVYMILENLRSGVYLKFANLITAVNIFYADFNTKWEEKLYG